MFSYRTINLPKANRMQQPSQMGRPERWVGLHAYLTTEIEWEGKEDGVGGEVGRIEGDVTTERGQPGLWETRGTIRLLTDFVVLVLEWASNIKAELWVSRCTIRRDAIVRVRRYYNWTSFVLHKDSQLPFLIGSLVFTSGFLFGSSCLKSHLIVGCHYPGRTHVTMT